MTTQAPQASQDLVAARELLDKLDAATQGADCDPQTAAVTAAAHSILVLAEQVAAIRVLIVGDAMSRHANGQPAPPQGNGRPAAEAAGRRAPEAAGRPAPAPEDKHTRRKRGWW